MPNPTHRCLLCGTQYFSPGECDWCPVQLTPIMDEAFFQRADAAYERDKASGALDRAREHRALQLQANMPKWGL